MLSHPTLFYALFSSPPPFNSLPCCFHSFSFLTSLQWKNIHNRSQNIPLLLSLTSSSLTPIRSKTKEGSNCAFDDLKAPSSTPVKLCLYVHTSCNEIKWNICEDILLKSIYQRAYSHEDFQGTIYCIILIQCSYSAQCALSCYNSISTIIVYQIPVHIISYYLISCHIILYNKSYYIRLCYVVSYYIISYQ